MTRNGIATFLVPLIVAFALGLAALWQFGEINRLRRELTKLSEEATAPIESMHRDDSALSIPAEASPINVPALESDILSQTVASNTALAAALSHAEHELDTLKAKIQEVQREPELPQRPNPPEEDPRTAYV